MIVSDLGMINNLGSSKHEIFQNIIKGNQDLLSKNHIFHDKVIFTGNVVEILPKIENPVFAFRSNQLLLHCFQQIENEWISVTKKYQPQRIGIILGSNNLGLQKSETHFRSYFFTGILSDQFKIGWIENGTICDFLKSVSGAKGPSYAISTACSSSAKAFASAKNLIENDICDACLVGGTDDLCDLTIRGFNSLGAYAKAKTNPFSKNRDGINIGEGASLFVVRKDGDGIKLCGVGESSDAYQVTSPNPTGQGAKLSIERALTDAKLNPTDIDYINLHGTGTIFNDAMESKAVTEVFGDEVFCSSTKSMTGHLMGAAGATEIGICWLTLSDFNSENFLPPHVYDGCDMENPINLVKRNSKKISKYCLSNSFAFGGSNASVILGK